MNGFLHKRLIAPLIEQLKQGVTPEKIALSIAFGSMVGIFPVIGLTSILCGLIGFSFRLNPVAIQVINYAVYPVQILLLVPFVRFGEYLTNSNPFPISPKAIYEMLQIGLLETIQYFWNATMHGILGWLVFTLPCFFVIYFISVPIMMKTKEKYVHIKSKRKEK